MYCNQWCRNCFCVSVAAAAAAAAKSLQSCLTLCDPIDGSPPGSPVPGILPTRTLEWVAISFSNAWTWKVKVKSLSRVWLLATPWTAATRLLHPWDFPGKSWSGVPLPSPAVRNPFFQRPNTCWSFILKRAHLLFSFYENFLLRTQMLFPTLSIPNIRFSLEPLCKILQGSRVTKFHR